MPNNLKYNKLWGGCFIKPIDPLMQCFNSSINFDQRLLSQDIRVSQAHVAMLSQQGIISNKDAVAIIKGLKQINADIRAANFYCGESFEDIHTYVEVCLKRIIGEPAERLHTARSRNDQVATDLRLWIMDTSRELEYSLVEYQRALVILAERYHQTIMPGYTHLQHAQPILFAHHILAYVDMAWRDRDRLSDCLKRVSVLPLGAAALAGTTYPIDPILVANELGFNRVFTNSIDAVSDRDFVAEFIFVLALIQIHLSRLAEELIIWSSHEFAFIILSDDFASGSSIMPQKKNPDAIELVRGKTGRLLGNLVSLLAVLKGLPLSYNKDLQEDKESLFDSSDTVLACLKIMVPILTGLIVCEERLRRLAEDSFLNATELADYLTVRGIPFRQAHEIAGQAVRLAKNKGCKLNQLELNDYKKLNSIIEKDIFNFLDLDYAINRRTSCGGTAARNVEIALREARRRLWSELSVNA